MWYRTVGVMGTGDRWCDEDISAAFALLAIDFDHFLTAKSDDLVSKLARRYCYNNKLHERVGKVDNLVKRLSLNGGVLIYFGSPVSNTVLNRFTSAGVPIYLFPQNFRKTLKKSWTQHEHHPDS